MTNSLTSSKMTHSMSRMMSAPLYSMLRRISVVMIRQLLSGLIWTSPVSSPTCVQSRGSM